MKKNIIVIVVVLLAALVGWRLVQKIAGQDDGVQSQQARGAATAVVAQQVLKKTIHDSRVFTGTLLPKSQFVVAPKVPGRLERLLVNIGSSVRNGDPIAILDSQEYTQQVDQAQAELDVARANVADFKSALDIATRELQRARELRKQQVASESEMDQAEARFRAAQAKHDVALAQVQQRMAALKADEVRLSYTRISAAWEGDDAGVRVVGERFVDEGAMLRANEPIASVLEVDTMVAAIFVIERDYPLIATGQRAAISTDAYPGQLFSGTIVRKAPLMKESSRQARVEIEIANNDRRLAAGMFVRAEIQFAVHEAATVVPMAAVVRRDGKNGVFMVDAQAMKARFIPVTAGIASAGLSEIIGPPLEGRVVTMGQHLLEDGGSIVIPEAAETTGAGAPGDAGSKRKAGARP